MITRESVSNADATRAFGPEVLTCPDCGHGIDPHGTDPGGPCGVSRCPCLLQPNGIACLLIEARNVHREQQAFDRGYDKAMEGIEARVREARAEGAADAYADVMRRAADESMACRRVAEDARNG